MLKSDIPELVVFFDLEWVPDAEAARKLYNLPPETDEAEAMRKLWEMSPDYSEDVQQPFLKYLFSRVVSIAFMSRKTVYRDGERIIEFTLNSLPKLPVETDDVDEAAIIEQFLTIVGRRRPQLVGFNSSESDFQVLIQRGIVNEITAPLFCERPAKNWDPGDYFRRWDNEDHLDLLKLFLGSNKKMAPKLDDVAKLCGFPGKIDVSGDQVWQLWLDRNITKIIEYNQLDVLNTYLVWLRIVFFTGRLSEEEYAAELSDFRAFLEAKAEEPEFGHLVPFLSAWDAAI